MIEMRVKIRSHDYYLNIGLFKCDFFYIKKKKKKKSTNKSLERIPTAVQVCDGTEHTIYNHSQSSLRTKHGVDAN